MVETVESRRIRIVPFGYDGIDVLGLRLLRLLSLVDCVDASSSSQQQQQHPRASAAAGLGTYRYHYNVTDRDDRPQDSSPSEGDIDDCSSWNLTGNCCIINNISHPQRSR